MPAIYRLKLVGKVARAAELPELSEYLQQTYGSSGSQHVSIGAFIRIKRATCQQIR